MPSVDYQQTVSLNLCSYVCKTVSPLHGNRHLDDISVSKLRFLCFRFQAYVQQHYGPECIKVQWMIDQFDDRHVLKGTASGKRLLEDAIEEDKVDDDLLGLLPNISRTLFQDVNTSGIDELEMVPTLSFDTDNRVSRKVPQTKPYRYACSQCNKPYKLKRPMESHQAKCLEMRQATKDYDACRSATKRLEEDSNTQRARCDRDAEARATSRQKEDSYVQCARRAQDTEATKEARRLARKTVLDACGVSASGHETDAINQDAENFHRFTLKSLRFVTCACCAREDGNGSMVQRLTVSDDKHLIAIRYMRELHAEVAKEPCDHVRYKDLDLDGLLPEKQCIGPDDTEDMEGIAFRHNDFICNKCVKALKKGAADFTKLAEDERPKLPIGMQGNFLQRTPFEDEHSLAEWLNYIGTHDTCCC